MFTGMGYQRPHNREPAVKDGFSKGGGGGEGVRKEGWEDGYKIQYIWKKRWKDGCKDRGKEL